MKANEVAIRILEVEEGFSEQPYYCSEGYPTIGIGQRIGPKGTDLKVYQFTCPLLVAQCWCDDKVKRVESALESYDWYVNCDQIRRAMLISMAYQLGVDGLKGFRKMLRALTISDWDTAYKEGLDSLWARQAPERAARQMEVIRSGELNECY
ncbi:glycoside hydrolase family protein [Vibrio mediterranei]|uniref:glycoside hydrolase family protein n=1 Tax=Vibrio mediterranei TaxID=689 RepID=UPI001EFD2281|nr:glycoside hydrolase family protein [Vibrio mediterranei]MCG9659727.1 glycoside hydrolase family protein [Vibrio mediterranei]